MKVNNLSAPGGMISPPGTQHNYMKRILDNFPDGVFTISLELEIGYVNPAFCRLIGFSANDLLGSKITDYLVDLDILKTCMTEVEQYGRCNDQETLFKRKDGSIVHVSKNVQAIYDDNGRIREILVSIRDMSELHRLNKDLEESTRQLELNNRNLEQTLDHLRETHLQLVESEKLASLGGLVAGIAHEINTPLGIGVTSSTALQEEVDVLEQKFSDNSLKRTELEAFIAHAGQACTILHTNLCRASNLIRSFKQVAVDQTAEELRTINLDEYLEEVLVSIAPSYKHSRVSVINECEPDIELVTHPSAIYQIISNLLINSMTHAYDVDSEGAIRIMSRQRNGNVEIEFSDNGKGISKSNIRRIFAPFFTTRRGSGGSGLGLSIVYNLVTGTLNGKISADSKEGEGTRFRISFPVSS